MKSLAIFGAKSIALGICHAVQALYKEYHVECFLVSDLAGNPVSLVGITVLEIESYSAKEAPILIATPENIQGEIEGDLRRRGFTKVICIDSVKEAELMERYYKVLGVFPSIHDLRDLMAEQKNNGDFSNAFEIYIAKFYRDKQLDNPICMSPWMVSLQVGAALTKERVAENLDSTGENISAKNVNYCELTGLYWIWKNKLDQIGSEKKIYYGLFQYRRILDMNERDVMAMVENDVDVVLPFPMMCEPDIREHHTRYLKESDWQAMLQALSELQPEYARVFPEIFSGPYMYNYNMIIAKGRVLADYCEWLFPILERTEELSEPKGWERSDRYIGYLGENLLTLYFMYNKSGLKIYHAGRRMLV